MNHLDTDALIAIGEALDWDVPGGLRHLESCGDCRAELDALRLSRSALTEREEVPARVVNDITRAVSAAATVERRRVARKRDWIGVAEAVLAGLTALIVVISSGVEIENIAAAALAFALGATLMLLGRAVGRTSRAAI
jgi:hypothetical protein